MQSKASYVFYKPHQAFRRGGVVEPYSSFASGKQHTGVAEIKKDHSALLGDVSIERTDIRPGVGALDLDRDLVFIASNFADDGQDLGERSPQAFPIEFHPQCRRADIDPEHLEVFVAIPVPVFRPGPADVVIVRDLERVGPLTVDLQPIDNPSGEIVVVMNVVKQFINIMVQEELARELETAPMEVSVVDPASCVALHPEPDKFPVTKLSRHGSFRSRVYCCLKNKLHCITTSVKYVKTHAILSL